jgi:transcriptional regulator with XRE-family HTH domain
MKSRQPLQKRIADALRKRREALGISQEAFADRIDMHRAYYGAIERGKKDIRLTTLERVCAGLAIGMWELMREAGG